MRILMVNWAKVWDGARIGGGANGYMLGLVRELASRGHEIACLAAGTEDVPDVDPVTFTPRPGPISIRRHDDWHGVKVFEVVNSPVLAPAVFNFEHPDLEVNCLPLTIEIAKFVHLLKPEIVHLHNIEGLSIDCVDAFGAEGARVIYSLHNYHTICPQVYLMQESVRPCHNFEGGKACETCAAAVGDEFDSDTEHLRRWHGAMRRLNVPIGPPLMPTIEGNLPLPFREVKFENDVTVECPFPVEELRGQKPAAASATAVAPPPEPAANLEPLTNDVDRDSQPDLSLRFGLRRAAMLAMLNRCDRVLAVSDFVARKYQSLGVRPSILQSLHIGSPAAEFVRVTRTSPRNSTDLIRLVFLGFNNKYKGLDVLLDAIESLPPATAAKFSLHLYASGLARSANRLAGIQSHLAAIETREGYALDDLPRLLSDKDIGIVPSIWWDNGPQTVLEFQGCGLPVLGAAVGGIPDFVTHGVNGLLFTGNDRNSLADALIGLATDETLLPRLSAGVKPPKSIRTHADEILSLYTQLYSHDGLVLEGGVHV